MVVELKLTRVEDRVDIETLYRSHVSAVTRWAGFLAGPSVDVEDVVQDVFLVAHRRLHEFRGEAKITTWLFRITENVSRKKRHQAKWRRFLGGSAEDVAGEVESRGPTPLDVLEKRRARLQIERIFRKMSDRDRTLLVLFEMDGRSGEEIAELTGTKLSTVWVYLHRARATFLRLLEKEERA